MSALPDTIRADGSEAREQALAGALARLAFGGAPGAGLAASIGPRHLAFLPPEVLELDLGDEAQRQFGDYELQEKLGQGGMGVVYRARQRSLDREVALKLLSAGPWASPDFIERFQREAQSAARMQHPNIVAVFEIGSHEELNFFSMRLVRGSSLAHLLFEQGRFAPRRAAELVRIVAEAVDYAHRLGVLHLDLKPGNVLIDERNQPQVADFGLARRLDDSLATDSDEISGTPSYMAPEQAQLKSHRLSPATDVYGLGAILYELLAGAPPFLAASAQETLKRVLTHEPERLRKIDPRIPADLEAVCQKCLRKEPRERYGSARELADELGRFVEGRMVQARPLMFPQRVLRWVRREPRLAFAAGLALLAMAIGLVATIQQWRRAEANAGRAETNAAVSNERLWQSRRQAALRLQLDGKGFEALPLLVDNIADQERAGIPGAGFIERREIGMVLAQGPVLVERALVADAPVLATAVSPDGSLVALGMGDMSVRWYESAGMTERGRVDLGELPTSDGEARGPRLLQFVDNRRLRVALDWSDYLTSPTDNNSWLVDLEHARVLFPPPVPLEQIDGKVYSPDAGYVVLKRGREAQLWQIEPWRALSPWEPVDFDLGELPWLLGRDARFVAHTRNSLSAMVLFDPRRAHPGLHVPMPGGFHLSAWTESGRGGLLAMGDSRGRVRLFDVATRTWRQLPMPSGQHVTWLAFSEDDAWLAVARRDGTAFAFDVATGEPINGGVMQHDFTLRQVLLSHRERLLVASGPGPDGPAQTALWRMPEQRGVTRKEATRLMASPARSSPAGFNALGASLGSGLLASASLQGEVSLWRLPKAALGDERGGGILAGTLDFDGAHLPDVEHDRLRVISTRGGPATPWIQLPQPPGVVELLDAGRTLIATSGPALYVFDAASMQARHDPIALPNNPMRAVATSDAAIAVFAYGGNGPAGFEERLEAYDLRAGVRLAGPVAVQGPLRQFELSPDGTRVLTTGPMNGATELFDVRSLRPLGRYVHDPDRPIVWASFDVVSKRLWLVARAFFEQMADNADLISWDPATGEVVRRVVPGVWPIGVASVAGKPLLMTRDRLVLDPAGAGERRGSLLGNGEATAVVAVSHDGRLIAHVNDRDVQLYDTATLAEVGPPLRSNLSNHAIPIRLAFSADDQQLVGRSTSLSWLWWPIPVDARPVAELRADVALLAPVDKTSVLEIVKPGDRERLRARDPGPWPTPPARPQPPAARLIDGIPVPARSAQTSPLQLDLTPAYDLAPRAMGDVQSRSFFIGIDSPGLSRLDGVDYDLRGSAELRWRSAPDATTPNRTPEISVPAVPIAAFHILLTAAQNMPVLEERTYANLKLRYRDGTVALVPLRTQREVPGGSDKDRQVPYASVAPGPLYAIGAWKNNLMSNPRLPNPHPEKLVATVALETTDSQWAELNLYAITAEPVIAGTGPRITADDGAAKRE